MRSKALFSRLCIIWFCLVLDLTLNVLSEPGIEKQSKRGQGGRWRESFSPNLFYRFPF